MPDITLYAFVAVAVLLLVLVAVMVMALARLASLRTELAVVRAQGEDLERDLRQDLANGRRDHSDGAQALRGEVGERLHRFTEATQRELAAATRMASEQSRVFAGQLTTFAGVIDQRLAAAATAQAEQASLTGERLAQLTHATQQQLVAATQAQSEELRAFTERLGQFTQAMQQQLAAATESQALQARTANERLALLTQSSEQRLDALRGTLEQRLDTLRGENAKKLDEMRATVDEKLQATLETRLGESFKLVSERLEQVHRGLGEMQSLATGVGDLKRVLTNVKTRGGWGEVQLGALLSDLLSVGQFEANVETRPGTGKRVEYAVRLPGRGDDQTPCWLPIDCKFPLEPWQRLQDAIDRADADAVDASRKALEQFFKSQAKDIRDKYVAPPHTTDFAILFVPTEGLFAEAVARPGLADALQRDFRVAIAGPTTLAAMLNSLQLGFRTLAIEQRSTEVWRVLGAVKTEFLKFGDILAKTKKKLDEAASTIDDAGRKSTTIARKLRDVEALPVEDADRLLVGAAASTLGVEDPADETATVLRLPLEPARDAK
jgi:DNA recombination protein RmuC